MFFRLILDQVTVLKAILTGKFTEAITVLKADLHFLIYLPKWIQKRIQVQEGNFGAGGQIATGLATPTDPREEMNFHNIWGSVSVEPQDAGANCQGTWLLVLLRENATLITFTDVVVNGEAHNAIIIACGVFSASNESPFNSGPIHPETSRTLQPGD